MAKVARKTPNGGNSLSLKFVDINQLGHFMLMQNADSNS